MIMNDYIDGIAKYDIMDPIAVPLPILARWNVRAGRESLADGSEWGMTQVIKGNAIVSAMGDEKRPIKLEKPRRGDGKRGERDDINDDEAEEDEPEEEEEKNDDGDADNGDGDD